MRSLLVPVVAAAGLVLAACSTTVGSQKAADRENALIKLRIGHAELNCQSPDCVWRWSAAREPAERMAAAQRWEDLADTVIAANLDQDLTWFYLGLAASGLGAPDAARMYLDRAVFRAGLGGRHACRGEACNGVNLPADATTLIASLPPPAQAAPAPRAPRTSTARSATAAARPPVTTATDPAPAAATGWVQPVPTSTAAASIPAAAPASGGGWVAPLPAR